MIHVRLAVFFVGPPPLLLLFFSFSSLCVFFSFVVLELRCVSDIFNGAFLVYFFFSPFFFYYVPGTGPK